MQESPSLRALRRLKEDLLLYGPECLKIRRKNGDIIPLHFNRSQLYLHEKLEEQRKRTGRVRAIVGKARQDGISTYVGARFFHRTSLNRGIQTYIQTHEQAATSNLFDMVDRFYRHSPLRPSCGLSNAKELHFDKLDSGYSVGTAGTKAGGRSATIQLFHGSEVAYWPNAGDHFAGVIQTVPGDDGTEIILESTGCGVGGEFHERWLQAEAGIGDYIPIFIPWYWNKDYYRQPEVGFIPDEEESECMSLYGLNLGQISWRRAKIAELKDPAKFKQEYPATSAEMFQNTGHDSFIRADSVVMARKSKCEGYGPLIGGADPARFGDDRFSVAFRRGRKVEEIISRNNLNTVQGASWIKSLIDTKNPAKLFIDLGGIGAGVFDILHSWGAPYDKVVVGVNFGSPPHSPAEYDREGKKKPGPKNRRAEMWKFSKEWLEQEGGVDIPDLDSLQTDACCPGYRYDVVTQDLVLESKEQIRASHRRSPDEWDAIALTFAEPVKDVQKKPFERAKAMGLSTSSSSWMAS